MSLPRRLRRNDQHHLSAAEGWLGLGSWFDANEELAKISPRMRAHPYVLHARYDVFALAGSWPPAVETARAICELLPSCSFGHLKWARALHKSKRTGEARDVLRRVADGVVDDPAVPYDLARYCCQLGELADALHWLEKAIELDGRAEIKKAALDEPDLQPLWQQIAEI